VTAGHHLNGIRDLIGSVFRDELPQARVHQTADVSLPGYYRCMKKWDLLVEHEGYLVAAIELKSQVGPSFGNNLNNRTEEAIGSAVDLWRSYEGGTFGAVRPRRGS